MSKRQMPLLRLVKVISVILRKVKKKKGKGVREFLEKELLCHQEVIRDVKNLRSGTLLT